MQLTEAQAAEVAKYDLAYSHERYRMGEARKADARAALQALIPDGGYLDVGCGRGEMLRFAAELGFDPVAGVEACEALIGGPVVQAPAWSLPWGDGTFDVVTMFDVIEHLLRGDDEATCRELARVARRHILLTANNRPSNSLGVELHVNRRPYEEWDRLFRQWFPGTVTWMSKGAVAVSEMWRVDL